MLWCMFKGRNIWWKKIRVGLTLTIHYELETKRRGRPRIAPVVPPVDPVDDLIRAETREDEV